MAEKRHFTVAAVAVALLLCFCSTNAAAPQETDHKAVDAALASITSTKSAPEPAKPAESTPDKSAAAVSQPQHAPQFPAEDSSQVHKGQESPPAASTPAAAPKQPEQPAVVAPSTPAAATQPNEQQPQQQQQEAPKQPEAPKAAAPATEQKQQEPPKPAADTPKPAQKVVNKDEVVDAFEDARRKKEAQKNEPEKDDDKDQNPCKRVPGCMECKPFDPKAPFEGFGLRRLHQKEADWADNMSAIMSTGQKGQEKKGQQGRVNLDSMSMTDSPYNAKDLPVCTACNITAGYVAHSRGRCACKPGFGDTSPTGTCARCPHGFFSVGGFRAVCVECEGVAFSNSDHTACVCASGWYGVTSYATKQASCNQCPGSRPVSPEGARSASDCMACPEGQRPNEIYSACVDPSKIPVPEPTAGPVKGAEKEENKTPEAPKVKPLFNSTTFDKTREEWTFHTRNTQNHSNIFTDLFGSIMDNVMTSKNVTASAKTPGELLYQMISRPAAPAPKLPTLPNIDLQNPAQLGAAAGAALSAVPAVLGAAAQNGGKIQDVVDSVTKAVETGSQQAGADMAAANGNAWDSFLKGLTTTAPKDAAGNSEVADFAKSLGDLFGAAGKVATDVASKSDNSLVKSLGGMLSAAQKGENVQVPLSPEAALIAAPEQEAATSNSWSGMLSNLLGGQQAAAPAAPAAAAAEAPAAGNDWTKLLSSLSKAAAPAAPAAPVPAAGSTSDILKMLSGLTAPAEKKADASGIHTITASSTHYQEPNAGMSSAAIAPDASGRLPNILTALSKYSGSSKTETSNTQQTTTTTSKDQQPAAGGLGNLLGGLFSKPAGQKTFSFANPNGGKLSMQAKLQQMQAATKQAADAFISVPSAPPKGSAAIKSGKFGGVGGKAKVMKGDKKGKAQ